MLNKKEVAILNSVKNRIQNDKRIAAVGRIKSWLDEADTQESKRFPVSCTVLSVEDSMEGFSGIEYSWNYVSKALRFAAGVAVDLSKLRPKGSDNGNGLVASGPVSFMLIYSKLNEVLRRGGRFKNGACTVYLDANHPDVLEFITLPAGEIPWVKRALYINDDPHSPDYILNNPNLQQIIYAVNAGTLWLSKKRWEHPVAKGSINYPPNSENVWEHRLFTQVCVTKDTWVTTSNGPRQVKDLIHKSFEAHLDGTNYPSVMPPVVHEGGDFDGVVEPSGYIGFFPTGLNPVFKVTTNEGFSFEATENHLVETKTGMIALKDLVVGTEIQLNNVSLSNWQGDGTFKEGWLLGSLIGDGTFAAVNKIRLSYWGEHKDTESKIAIDYLVETCPNSKVYTYRQSAQDKINIESIEFSDIVKKLGVVQGNKYITPEIEKCSFQFYRGFLRGYFDANSTVQGNLLSTNGKCISLTSVSIKNLEAVQRMLLRLGIMSRICKGTSAGLRMLPDGKSGHALYNCKESRRLIISGKSNLTKFLVSVGFNHPGKQSKLEKLVNSYELKNTNERGKYATVKVIEYVGEQETFDCAIDKIHKFDANGVIVSNCTEILLKSRATCLLMHVNLGQCTLSNLVLGGKQTMKTLCQIHGLINKQQDTEYYLSNKVDKQVGMGVIGLANFLAKYKVTYKEFADYLDAYTKDEFTTVPARYIVKKIVTKLVQMFYEATEVASSYGMDRAFTIAPCATVSYNHVDSNGYTTSPEISPPICHPESKRTARDSDTFGIKEYQYPPNCESAQEVGFDTYFKLANAWQRMMNNTGKAHCISFNIWNEQEFNLDFFTKWLESSLVTTYYRMMETQDFADKSSIEAGGVYLEDIETDTNFFIPDVPEEDNNVVTLFGEKDLLQQIKDLTKNYVSESSIVPNTQVYTSCGLKPDECSSCAE